MPDSISVRYYDGSVFGVTGSVTGAIPTYHTQNGYSGTGWLTGTVETITTDISNRNIKLIATNNYVQDVSVSINSGDTYEFDA